MILLSNEFLTKIDKFMDPSQFKGLGPQGGASHYKYMCIENVI